MSIEKYRKDRWWFGDVNMLERFCCLSARRLVMLATLVGLAGCSGPTVTNLKRAQFHSLAGLSSTIMTSHNFSEHDADARIDPLVLGFAPVDRVAAADFSLEIARKQNQIDAPMLSFGMLSASFGSSFPYSLAMRNANALASQQVALAQTSTAP